MARPLAVSRPVERLERIPGPRVTEMKSGFTFVVIRQEAERREMAKKVVVPVGRESGRLWRALATSFARFSWCESKDIIG